MTTKDGYSWTKADGLRPGIPCLGVIQPPTNMTTETDKTKTDAFDVIVVGAGYAGLTAAREACIAGLKVLLLEARDRIGGRSWSSNIAGCPYELGGTWVYWGQAAVWREIVRYGMQDELESSFGFPPSASKFLLVTEDGTQSFSHEEEANIMEKALAKLFNVDGANGRLALAMPHSTQLSESDRHHDSMSVADRLADIADDLTPAEHAVAVGFALLISGATLATASFYELLHWWALCDHSFAGCVNHLMRFKFRHGQSSFARRFWDEALRTGNLRYAFSSPVARVHNGRDAVHVETRAGALYTARRMVSALPLNILPDIAFDPPLLHSKAAAARAGHVNQTVKVHADVSTTDPHLRYFTALSYPDNGLVYAIGGGETPAGNTHLVAFGGQHRHFHPEDDIHHTIAQLNAFTPMQVERMVFHNWSRDEFAKGAWFFSAPGLISSHLQDLRARQGNIFFASADWATGWRSFIDGAIDEGTRAAANLRADLIGRQQI